jgi:hypothetical protein
MEEEVDRVWYRPGDDSTPEDQRTRYDERWEGEEEKGEEEGMRRRYERVEEEWREERRERVRREDDDEEEEDKEEAYAGLREMEECGWRQRWVQTRG